MNTMAQKVATFLRKDDIIFMNRNESILDDGMIQDFIDEVLRDNPSVKIGDRNFPSYENIDMELFDMDLEAISGIDSEIPVVVRVLGDYSNRKIIRITLHEVTE
jgi:hypothetical protein